MTNVNAVHYWRRATRTYTSCSTLILCFVLMLFLLCHQVVVSVGLVRVIHHHPNILLPQHPTARNARSTATLYMSASSNNNAEKKKKTNHYRRSRPRKSSGATTTTSKPNNNNKHLNPNPAMKFNERLKHLIKLKKVKKAQDLLLTSLHQYSTNDDDERSRSRPPRQQLRPDKFHFAIVLNGWAKLAKSSSKSSSSCSSSIGSADRAEALLHKMEQYYYTQQNMTWLEANTVHYNSVIHAHACAGSAMKAHNLLNRMENCGNNSSSSNNGRIINGNKSNKIKPDTVTYTTVIDAWAKSSARGALKNAEDLLRRMEELYAEQNNNQMTNNSTDVVLIKPNTVTYNAVLYARSRHHSHSAEAVEEMLKRMEYMYEVDGNVDVRPSIISYNTLLHAWSKQSATGDEAAGAKAEQLLCRIECMHHTNDGCENENSSNLYRHIRPNTVTYSTVIDALSKSNVRGAAIKAQKLLDYMEHSENVDVKPNTVTYTSVIDAWAKNTSSHHRNNAAQNAERILLHMEKLYACTGDVRVKPNSLTYSSVINAWSKSNDSRAIDKAEAILQRMESLYDYGSGDVGVRPETVTYTSVIDALAKGGKAERALELLELMETRFDDGADDLKPTVHTYNAVMNALAKSRGVTCNAPALADALLIRMNKRFEAGLLDAGPDAMTYTTMMNVLAKSHVHDSVQRAEKIMKKMSSNQDDEFLKPAALSYSSLINVWAKSNLDGAANRAELILRTCIQEQESISKLESKCNGEFSSTQIEVVSQSYDAVIDAWARSKEENRGERAEVIFYEMLKRHQAGYAKAKPTIRSVNKVLLSWARCNSEDAAHRAEVFLDRVDTLRRKGTLDLIPNSVSYTTVIEAWANSSCDPELACKNAEVIMATLESAYEGYGIESLDLAPSIIAYTALLKVWARNKDVGAGCKRADDILNHLQSLSSDDETAIVLDKKFYDAIIRIWKRNRSAYARERVATLKEQRLLLRSSIKI